MAGRPLSAPEELDALFSRLGLSRPGCVGRQSRGCALGVRPGEPFERRVKAALDPAAKFPASIGGLGCSTKFGSRRWGRRALPWRTPIESCVHCGFCLPACPTYRELGEEMDSPRGRIFLMKSALEGDLTVEETLPYIDRCLACLGCVTACPSGVHTAS